MNDAEVAEHLKEVEPSLADKIHESVFNQLKVEDVAFDRLGVGTGWTKKDGKEKPVIVIHFIVDSERYEFPFLQEAIETEPIDNFAQFFVDFVKRRFTA